ncbi:hypothetical protein AYO40_00270 [Planctomycetaceae bacterium SCGC AG-212-D15]|nr:hypothetical protein AYO40_00270 [Planctomycetaceae bacterium SCGC AG-212-D15]
MADRTLGLFLKQLRRAAEGRPSSDGQLLERFAADQDQSAFETLLERHGSMVWGVCHRELNDPNDVEDAFQATFLILARKARAIAKHESVGSWLHGVAHRVAVRARWQANQRRLRERQAATATQAGPDNEPVWNDLRRVLDEELDRLPEKYRAPLVLCYLEGKTNDEAADQLGWTRGTIAGRLSRARELLRGRLTRRGIAIASGAMASMLSEATAPAAARGSLAPATMQAALAFAGGSARATPNSSAVALAEGVLGTMNALKLRMTIAVMMILGILGSGAGVVLCRALAQATSGTGPVQAPAPAPLIVAAPAAPAVPAFPAPQIVHKPIVVWTGPHSAIGKQSYLRITDREAWEKLWREHVGNNGEKGIDGKAIVPEVNFEACMVIALLAGDAVNHLGFGAVSITGDNDQVVFRFQVRGIQTGEPGIATRPYGIFVVPSLSKRLVLESDVQTRIGGEPQWKEVARFEKLADAKPGEKPREQAGAQEKPPMISIETNGGFLDHNGRFVFAQLPTAVSKFQVDKDGSFRFDSIFLLKDGTGTFHGKKTGKLPKEAVAELVKQLEQADFGSDSETLPRVDFRWLDADSAKHHKGCTFPHKGQDCEKLLKLISELAAKHEDKPK